MHVKRTANAFPNNDLHPLLVWPHAAKMSARAHPDDFFVDCEFYAKTVRTRYFTEFPIVRRILEAIDRNRRI